MSILKERNMFVTERFLSDVVEKYGEHPVSSDGGTWYPQACRIVVPGNPFLYPNTLDQLQ